MAVNEYRSPAGAEISAAVCEKALALAITPFRNIAREYGYTLAVHGSLARDIDLVAVPWTEQAGDAEILLGDLKGAAVGVFGRARLDPKDEWNEKPHGRRARSIHIFCEGHFFYFDISVMPLAPKPPEKKRGKP